MLADNLVHELGHIKLFALGVYKESSLALVVNPPTETFKSPVRPYPRPMSAVLHAAYAFAHVTELEHRLCADPPDWVPLEVLENRLRSNRGKVKAAIDEVKLHARTDQIGKEFLDGLYDWTDRLIAGR
jgi:HEXXH motif-containing protein